jgi:glycine oxidase
MKVVIIGAGVAGLSIGWRLRLEGVDVTILERARAAQAATWASAGMIAVAGEMGHVQSPEADFGRHASGLWPDFAKNVEAASGMEIGYRQCGTLLVSQTQTELQIQSQALAWPPLSPAETRAREPMLSRDIAGGFWAPDDAQVDNRALGQALARAFVAAGGVLSPNEPVVGFDVVEDTVVSVQTPFRRCEADAFVIAAGAWSGELGGLPPEALPPVRPIKGEMIAVAPPVGAHLPKSLIWGNGIYLVPRPDRVLIGATVAEAGFDTSVTSEAADWLSSRAIALMPSLAHWEIVERWAGLRPGSPDGLPILGPTPLGKLFAATGQFRNGILFAPAIAENISRLVLGRAAPIPAFDPRRFRTETPAA